MIQSIIAIIIGSLTKSGLNFLFDKLVRPLLLVLWDRGLLVKYTKDGQKKVELLREAKENDDEAAYNSVIDDV